MMLMLYEPSIEEIRELPKVERVKKQKPEERMAYFHFFTPNLDFYVCGTDKYEGNLRLYGYALLFDKGKYWAKATYGTMQSYYRVGDGAQIIRNPRFQPRPAMSLRHLASFKELSQDEIHAIWDARPMDRDIWTMPLWRKR